ncbi:copper amine oxidase N-terminal domain-containing protein [Peptococcus simiae]|uniref:Copper amine oxidase N-terminal domain-containing protein n=1 Tax=Peptococcus simiae TaxID=1643805 RepID=A0ABW9H0F8_9FIRM
MLRKCIATVTLVLFALAPVAGWATDSPGPTTIVKPSTTDNSLTKDAFGDLVDAQGNTHPDTVAAKLGRPLPAGSDQVASWDLTLVVNSQVCRTTAAEGAPYINNQGRTMIPLRVVNDAFGYQTDWQPDGTIHITGAAGTVDVTLTVGQAAYTANGQAGRFATLTTLTNNRTYLPARDFAQLYGHIYWDSPSRTVWVYQGKEPLYQVIGTKVLRANDTGIQELTLPAGYTPLTQTATNPLVLKETIQGVTYLGLMTQGQDFSQKVPLFQVKDQALIYLTDVFGSSHFYVDGSKVYYTDGTGAASWTNPIQPNRLYIADTASGQVTSHDLAFPVNTSTFSMKDGKLIATDQQGRGTAREIDLNKLPAGSKVGPAPKLSFVNEKTIHDGDLTADEGQAQVKVHHDLFMQLLANQAQSFASFEAAEKAVDQASLAYVRLESRGDLDRLRTPLALMKASFSKMDKEASFSDRVAAFQKQYPVAAQSLTGFFEATASHLQDLAKDPNAQQNFDKLIKDYDKHLKAYRDHHPEDLYQTENLNGVAKLVFYTDGSLALLPIA